MFIWQNKIEYLGHIIASGTLAVPDHRITALAQYIKPINKKTLRSFLGCMSYYRKFIPQYSDMSALLTPSTAVSAPKVVVWTADMDTAFQKLKVSLCNNVCLTIPSVLDQFSLQTDASGFGVGACLHVCRDGEQLPVAFYSRQLQGAEKRYSITELETLAIVSALKYFEFYLYGTHIHIVTDHKACTALLTSTVLNTRLKRMTIYLQDKDLNIVYNQEKIRLTPTDYLDNLMMTSHIKKRYPPLLVFRFPGWKLRGDVEDPELHPALRLSTKNQNNKQVITCLTITCLET